MTTFIRDMSHYDGDLSLAGYAGCTHKITEGRTYVDPAYAGRMPGLRTTNRVLGSYHVLHTGNLADQLAFWIAEQDKLTPWWRDWPHWIMQVDAEKWPGDPVSGPIHMALAEGRVDLPQAREIIARRISTTVTFAGMLVNAGLPATPITYASRGQYGNSLTGIATDLWNAAYHSSSYPGDGAADWNPYSGRTPVLWQYTSTPYDKNAFRGSVTDLLAYIEGGGVALTDTVPATGGRSEGTTISDLWNEEMNEHSGFVPSDVSPRTKRLMRIEANTAAILAAVGKPVAVTLDPATVKAISDAAAAAAVGHHDALSDADLAGITAAIHTQLTKLGITVQVGA